MRQSFRIPIFVEERAGLERHAEPVRHGIPLPQGSVRRAADIAVLDGSGQPVPNQARALTSWPDQSIKWLLVDALTSVAARGTTTLFVCPRVSGDGLPEPRTPALEIAQRGETIVIETGAARFATGRDALLSAARVAGVERLDPSGVRLRLVERTGRECTTVTERLWLEESGRVRAAVLIEGKFLRSRRVMPLRFKARLVFIAGTASVRLEVGLLNPQAAGHPGGTWDVADRGTVHFRDLSVVLTPAAPVRELRWSAESCTGTRTQGPDAWSLYQDSSGGENWDSENHVDGSGSLAVTFRGYQVRSTTPGATAVIGAGARAEPSLSAVSDQGAVGATALEFWQNFPKALRWDTTRLSVGLFPAEQRCGFALQGGEQKRHTIMLDFPLADPADAIARAQRPLAVWLDPAWVQSSGALAGFVSADRDANRQYLQYINAIIAGPHSFGAKRELIDEYGWRNFGDLYADHEGVGHPGPRPLVSHYNNQYDFVYGALVHYLRTGDVRWRQLGDQAAQHTVDIDIYHTDRDKAAFNHGLFWHTDHHQPAATCTHRTYSRRNARHGSYGGGPSNEHNYTSGLLLYYLLSGDAEAAGAVCELANWVLAMDDGARNALGLIDAGPTGLASKTADPRYHKAGRGAGNSINALLDAYQLTRQRRYVEKAEELIRRCIHPGDDIQALGLSEPEHRWSYLVFLQVLGKYLDFKLEWGETGYAFHYARASLLHYARWMLDHEVPYCEVLHKVELPTETWPAHDVRKSHILHVAAKYCAPEERAAMHRRAAFFFERSLQDVLRFETAYLTRPLVILCVYGYLHAYYQANALTGFEMPCPDYLFGSPEVFTPQKQRIRAALRAKLRACAADLRRAAADKLAVLCGLFTAVRP